MIPSSPFFPEFANMNAAQIAALIEEAKKSGLNNILKLFNQRTNELQQEALQATVTELAKNVMIRPSHVLNFVKQ